MPEVAHAIKWEHVDSSNVNRVAYAADEHKLAVEFNGGSLYVYSGVDLDTYHNLIGAESVGKYLNRVVKPLHPFERFDDEASLAASI